MDPVIKSGSQAPQFQLPDLKGNIHSLNDMRGWTVVINFWSAECPWSLRVDQELSPFLDAWEGKVGVWWVASNANESIRLIEAVAMERNLPRVLIDQTQQVADLYGAQVTPHFFIVDIKGNLAYQGAWDDITFRQRIATRVYVPEVVQALNNNQASPISQTLPYGCVLVRDIGQDS